MRFRCKCNKGKLHGPFTYVSFKKGKRVYYRYISSKRLNEIRQYINNYHFFQEKIARLNEINRKITVLLKESQRNNLLPIPEWIGNFDGLFDFRPSCRKREMIPLIYLLSTYSLKVILR